MTPRAALERGVDELGLALSDDARGRLMQYVALIEKWNRTYNLTAVRDPHDMVKQHLLDSLAVVPHLSVGTVADVGSGAGLPGIPLAIARPDWQVTVNDANQKKAAFLRQAVIELGLKNATVHEGRVEAWRPASGFAIVISRAFAELSQFISLCRHLVAPGGLLAAMMGAAPNSPGERCRILQLQVPFLDARRHLVLCPAS
jgi:16S rRNA (guanine527-N7)-methyltransferase